MRIRRFVVCFLKVIYILICNYVHPSYLHFISLQMKSDNDASHCAGPSTSTDSTKQSDTGSCRMCVSCMRPCLTRHNPLPPNPTIPQKLCYAFMCPAHGVVAEWCNLALVTFITWAVFWSITVSDALPGGNFFALFMLVVFGVIAGEFMKKISLPPLLGIKHNCD